MAAVATYPVHVDASLDHRLSRWLWLVKWFLAIPHYVVLALLWVAFVVLSIGAFFAILFTGRYPHSIFDFNVGVLRWSWRVHYYTFGALATDRYPPFTLDDVPDYPAHLDIDYPGRLSRGLVLVKWWLLALPHYLLVGVFLGGATWGVFKWGPGGLIGLLALIAGVILLFTGRYPQPIFDFVLGLNRWVLRVAAYAGLMTDDYPPFRLDPGGHETSAMTVTHDAVSAAAPDAAPLEPPPAVPPPYGAEPEPSRWRAGRVVAVVCAALLLLVSLALLAAGGVATWATNNRDGGYVTSGVHSYSSAGYAISSERISISGATFDHGWQSDLLGKVRVRVASDDPRQAVFVGIGRAGAVDAYLQGVSRTVLQDLAARHDGSTAYAGRAPSTLPAKAGIWLAQANGVGRQTLVWPVTGGDWTIVVMNADGSRVVAVSADVGATLPDLGWIAGGLFIAAAVVGAAGATILVLAVRRAAR